MSVSCVAGEVVFTILRSEQDSAARKSSSRRAVFQALLALRAFDVQENVPSTPPGKISMPQPLAPVSFSQAPLRL
jgi:hypothetical protein